MKFIVIIFSFISLRAFSQKEIRVDMKRIAESKTLGDIINEIPKNCKVYSFVFLMNVGSALKQYICAGNFSPEVKKIISQSQKGQWFFVEDIKSDCMKSHSATYKIFLE